MSKPSASAAVIANADGLPQTVLHLTVLCPSQPWRQSCYRRTPSGAVYNPVTAAASLERAAMRRPPTSPRSLPDWSAGLPGWSVSGAGQGAAFTANLAMYRQQYTTGGPSAVHLCCLSLPPPPLSAGLESVGA